jgi:DNA-damage-inducible protein D
MNSEVVDLSNDEFLRNFLSEFESKAQKDENGIEFWFARELQQLLGYEASWQNFEQVIEKAKTACEGFGQAIDSHFNDVIKMVKSGVAPKPSKDLKLTRYACYLIAQNADVRKKPVAFAQTYFAVQTRRRELDDIELNKLSENEKRIQLRQDIRKHNALLSGVAKNAGVLEPLDYAIFQNHGYKGLYGGLDKNGIANKKSLSKKDDILDHMGSEELGANIFRITQTTAKIQRESVNNKCKANEVHYEVGKKIRDTIREIGGTMPENLSTAENIKKVEKEQKKKIKEEKKTQKLLSKPKNKTS